MGSPNLTRAWFRVVAGTLLCLSAGCQGRLIRKPIDLAEAYRGPVHAPIAVDARLAAKEWRGAVSAPFGTKGKARFLWDDEGIYCGLSDERPISEEHDEYLCISFVRIDQEHRYVRLYLAGHFSRQPEIVKAAAGQSLLAPDLDPAMYRFKSATMLTAAAPTPWQAELSLSWRAFSATATATAAPPKKLLVHVFRIKGQRPYSFLRMAREQ